MKKVAIIVAASLFVFILGVWGGVQLLSDGVDDRDQQQSEEAGMQNELIQHDDGTVEQVNPSEPIQHYDNGMATFAYDSTKLMFFEMPSDSPNGYPMTSFQPVDAETPLPRIDVIPLELEAPFTADVPQSDWENLVKSLMLAYYNEPERANVLMNITGVSMKVEENQAKMFLNIDTSLPGSATPDMSGSIRLVSKDNKAVVTLALTYKGGGVPQEMQDAYMSVTLH